MLSETNFKNLIEYYLSVDNPPDRQDLSEQIIESISTLSSKIEKNSLDSNALEMLAQHIKLYSLKMPSKNREILKFEIGVIVDMIT